MVTVPPRQRHDNAQTYAVHQYFEVTTIYACMLKADFYIYKDRAKHKCNDNSEQNL